MTAFTPADGVTPRWRKLADLVESLQPGDGITFADALAALDEPGLERQALHGAMRQAAYNLERGGSRTVAARSGYGWVVLNPQQTMSVAESHRKRAHNQVKSSMRKLDSADAHRAELSQDEREALDRAKAATQALEGLLGRRRRTFQELAGEMKQITG